MTLPAPFLTGRRGWMAVASLTALLGALLLAQLPLTSVQADAPPVPAPAAAPAAVIEQPAPPVVPPVVPPIEAPPVAPPVAAPPVAAPPAPSPPPRLLLRPSPPHLSLPSPLPRPPLQTCAPAPAGSSAAARRPSPRCGPAPRTPWYGCSGCTDFATPAGDFAEVYAQWARGATTNRSEIAGDVGAAQLAVLAATFFGA